MIHTVFIKNLTGTHRHFDVFAAAAEHKALRNMMQRLQLAARIRQRQIPRKIRQKVLRTRKLRALRKIRLKPQRRIRQNPARMTRLRARLLSRFTESLSLMVLI